MEEFAVNYEGKELMRKIEFLERCTGTPDYTQRLLSGAKKAILSERFISANTLLMINRMYRVRN